MSTIKGGVRLQTSVTNDGKVERNASRPDMETGGSAGVDLPTTQPIGDRMVREKDQPGGSLTGDARAEFDPELGSRPATGLLDLHLAKKTPVDLFDADTWKPGALNDQLKAYVKTRVDGTRFGKIEHSYDTPAKLAAYRETLGGKPVSSYDQSGFLKTCGVENPLASGRESKHYLKGLELVSKEYKPDTTYFKGVQKVVGSLTLGLNKVSSGLAAGVESALSGWYVERTEAPDMKGPREELHGNPAHIQKGDRSGLSNDQRYRGLAVERVQHHPWGADVHVGSTAPGAKDRDKGTFDICLKTGFTRDQSQRIGDANIAVDENQTHYIDPATGKPRNTKSGAGAKGDYHWHFNRSPAGEEDTRIAGAKIHLDRAVELANGGYHDAAERELGYGLHKLQDVFSHGQMLPTTHATVDGFPDLVNYHPVAKFESDLATEGYLKEFARRLNLTRPGLDEAAEVRRQEVRDLVARGAGEQAKAAVEERLRQLLPPDSENKTHGLLAQLRNAGVQIHVVKEGSDLARLGFGVDVDGDGKVTAGAQRDINRDGEKQWYETEGSAPDGRTWSEHLGGYSHDTRNIFISERALREGKLDAVLRHELRHAADMILQSDPLWDEYRNRLYNDLRRLGVDFYSDQDEVIAGLE